jgi:hypothetical protein
VTGMKLSPDGAGVAKSLELARVPLPRLPRVPLPLVFVAVRDLVDDSVEFCVDDGVEARDVGKSASISACVRFRRYSDSAAMYSDGFGSAL